MIENRQEELKEIDNEIKALQRQILNFQQSKQKNPKLENGLVKE